MLNAACRETGCLREALAVASTRLLHADPAVQQLRQQYAASLTPIAAAEGDAPAQPTAAAAAARKGIKPHSEAAAANLLLLDQPAAAAMALASRDGGSNAAAMQTAAQVAALAAAHKVGTAAAAAAAGSLGFIEALGVGGFSSLSLLLLQY